MLVNEMRLSFVLQNDRKRIEALHDPAQLEAVHQVNDDRNGLALDLSEIGILQRLRPGVHSHAFTRARTNSLACSGCTRSTSGSLRNHVSCRFAYRRVARMRCMRNSLRVA